MKQFQPPLVSCFCRRGRGGARASGRRARRRRSRCRAPAGWMPSSSAPVLPASRPRDASRRRASDMSSSRPRNEVGGRCITDTKIFGVPYDRGAHWPLRRRHQSGGEARRCRRDSTSTGRRPASACASAGATRVKARWRTFSPASCAPTAPSRMRRARADVACAQVLPEGSRRMASDHRIRARPLQRAARNLPRCPPSTSPARASATTVRSAARVWARCWRSLRPGFAVLLGDAGDDASNGGANRASRSKRAKRPVSDARAVIVTVSTNVLTAGKIKFAPDLPKRHLDAADKLKLGSHDHIALELTGNPLGLRADELVFEKVESRQTAAMLANMGGSHALRGRRGRQVRPRAFRQGRGGDDRFRRSTGSAGSTAPTSRSRSSARHATRWNNEPWVLGAWSAAAPGAQPARKVLTEPLSGRVFFAGEAAHETLWGTVDGAWESGERAADAVLKRSAGARRPSGHGRAARSCVATPDRPAQRLSPRKVPPVALADLGDDLRGDRLDLLRRSWSFLAAARSRRSRSTSCRDRCPCLRRRRTR